MLSLPSTFTGVLHELGRKRIKKYSFSNDELRSVDTANTLVWSKLFCFVLVQTKTNYVKNALGTDHYFFRGRENGQFSKKKKSYTAKSAEKHRVSAYYYSGPVFQLKKKKRKEKNIIAQAKDEKKYFILRKLPSGPQPAHPQPLK